MEYLYKKKTKIHEDVTKKKKKTIETTPWDKLSINEVRMLKETQ